MYMTKYQFYQNKRNMEYVKLINEFKLKYVNTIDY